MNSNCTRFRSCFIVDVAIDECNIKLTDSSLNQYFIMKSENNRNVLDSFKSWFKDVFTKGVSQTLTIFQYEIKDVSDCETEMHIVKFLNANKQQILIES